MRFDLHFVPIDEVISSVADKKEIIAGFRDLKGRLSTKRVTRGDGDAVRVGARDDVLRKGILALILRDPVVRARMPSHLRCLLAKLAHA